jgi:Tol biopolymer transport system component
MPVSHPIRESIYPVRLFSEGHPSMNRLFAFAPHTAATALVMILTACLLVGAAPGPRPAFGQDPKEKEKPESKQTTKKDEPKKKDQGLPLKPNRTIEFTTDEGTWVSLDVSPDGKTILFELLGDLYTVGIEGGEAKAITTGPHFDSSPRYSPDGKSITFISDKDGAENLWIASKDGSDAKALTKDKQSLFVSPSWTPDGDYILVSRQPQQPWSSFELWMYHIRGGSGIAVTKGKTKPDAGPDDYVHAIGAVATADGKFLYYTKRNKLFNAYNNLNFPLSQIVRRDRTTGDEDTVTEALGSAFRPLLSPDGSKFVYGTRVDNQTGLRIREIATGEERWLKLPVQRDEQESRFTRDLIPGCAFTPDGKSVLAAYGGKIHRIDVQTLADPVIPITVRVSQPVYSRLNFPIRVDDGPVQARLIQAPDLSPDGKRLAFSALTKLYLVDLPDGKPRQLSAGESREFHPSWSPDGKWIAYVNWAPEGGHIWKRPGDGRGEPERLTRVPAFYREPAWSPDGKQIVALRAPRRQRNESEFNSGANLDLIAVPAQGGEASLISPARGASRPHFSKDADRIYVTTPAGLISMRFDGTDRRTHVSITGKNAYSPNQPNAADEILVSPDSRWVLALVTNQLYLLAVPHYGGEPPKIPVHEPSVPIKKLTDIGADYAGWADGGKTITWAIGSSFFRLPVESIVFEPTKSGDGDKGDDKEKAEAEKKELKPKPVELPIVVERPRSRPHGTIVLRGANIITMRADEVIAGGEIVITDNRITQVGPKGSAKGANDARVVDVAGMTIVPGFIDTHPHWNVKRGVLDMQTWSFFANLAYGVTSGRDPQTGTNDMFAYQDLVDTGDLFGPRLFSTGPGILSDTDFQSAEEVESVVARFKKYYRTNTVKSYMVGNRRQRQWMIEACQKNNIMPTTEGGLDLKLNLTHALDGFSGNEHSLPVVPLFGDVVKLFASTGISYTPTLLVAYGGPWGETFFFTTTSIHDDPKIRRFIPHQILDAKVRRSAWFHKDEHVFSMIAESAAKVARAGGHVCIGSHGEMQGIGYHWEMWALASGGWQPLEVLRAATAHGAEAIGYAQDLGSIEPGKLADMVVLKADPLKDIHNTTSIRYVMKNGELFEGDTLDRIWPDKKPLSRLWWWEN